MKKSLTLLWSECIPQNIEIQISKDDGLGVKPLGGDQVMRIEFWWMEIVPYKKALERSLGPSTMWGQWEDASYEPRRRALGEHNHADALILDFQPLESVMFCYNHQNRQRQGFSIFTMLYDHHHYLVLELFYHHRWKPHDN